MKNISLAAKYRPQTFASVVGQETIKTILEEAAFQNKVAPAYLLSGTRGVGKTTLARVFAKALNCENAQSRKNGEPCNVCSSCQRITQGAYVDVVEIDGASNRGIEDAKKIREMVQYAPLEGRYKVIIIDEAHMLTRESFNALLKTLEEPPSYTTFILATTEAHKFPITIVSRCQHFVFKPVPESTLNAHLKFVLESENWKYEDEAIQLIVRRAAGSVRDSMSLLGQSLALATNAELTATLTRSVLGLAGKEILDNLLTAIAENNTLLVATTVQDMMMQGTDIAYFLKEFAQLWRSFFLLKQHSTQALKLLSLSEDEGKNLIKHAELFSPSYIHSAWQMTLDAQRKITTSLEPAVAIELFLINLAILPQLLPLQELKADIVNTAQEKQKSQEKIEKEEDSAQKKSLNKEIEINLTENHVLKNQANTPPTSSINTQEAIENTEIITLDPEALEVEEIEKVQQAQVIPQEKQEQEEILPPDDIPSNETLSYEAFLDFLETNKHTALIHQLKHIRATFSYSKDSRDNKQLTLTLYASSSINSKQLHAQENKSLLKSELLAWAHEDVKIDIKMAKALKTSSALQQELDDMPIIQEIKSALNAHILYCESTKPE